jgi:hypothetical protein
MKFECLLKDGKFIVAKSEQDCATTRPWSKHELEVFELALTEEVDPFNPPEQIRVNAKVPVDVPKEEIDLAWKRTSLIQITSETEAVEFLKARNYSVLKELAVK